MPDSTSVEFAPRLTIKDLGCDPKAVKKLPEGQTKLPIARMYGIVSRVGYQEDQNAGQSYTFFVGSFEGVNLQTGELLQSSKMYLPEGASQALEHIFKQAVARNKGAMVNFAFEILAVAKPDNTTGYAYETHTILKPEQTDQLSAVRAYVHSHTKGNAAANDAAKDAAGKDAKDKPQAVAPAGQRRTA